MTELSIREVLARLEAGQVAMLRQMETQERWQQQRHVENQQQLQHINGKVGRAHERISALEAVVAGIEKWVQTLRERSHQFAQKLTQYALIATGPDGVTGHRMERIADDDKPITRVDLRWILIIGGAGIVLGVALAKLGIIGK